MTSGAGRTADTVQWIVGVGAATAVIMLFSLAGAGKPAPDELTNPAVLEEGAVVYDRRCASCHGAEGQGGQGPRLAGTVATLYPDPADEVAVVADGRLAMPSFADTLTGEEIAAVVAYTRSGLG